MNEPFLLSNLVELQDLDNKIYKLIDSKSNGENVLHLKSMEINYKELSEKITENKKELSEFLDQLSSKQFKEIEKFFETMPKLSHTVKVTNPNTKVENEIVLEGLSSFFE